MKIAPLCLLFTTFAISTAISQDAPAPAPPSNPDSFGTSLSIHTYLQPYRSIDISAIESDMITEIMVEEGERVVVNQELLKLDTRILTARLAVAEAQAKNTGRILAAESQYQLDKDRYEKLQSLETNTSEYELQQAQAKMKSSGGLLTEAMEQKNISELQVPGIQAELERRILRSPIDGVVVEIKKDIAEAVSPLDGQRDDYLIRVVKIDRLKSIAHIPADAARSLVKGGRMQFEVDRGPGEPPQIVEGVLEYVSPVIDSGSGTIRVRLAVENQDGKIRAGSAARLIVPSPGS